MAKLYLIPHLPIVSQLSEEQIREARLRLVTEARDAAHTRYLHLRQEGEFLATCMHHKAKEIAEARDKFIGLSIDAAEELLEQQESGFWIK